MDDVVKHDDVQIVSLPGDRSWYDPWLLTVATYPVLTTVIANMGNPVPVAPANPRRWAIGFFQSNAPAAIQIAPWPDVDLFTFDLVAISGGQKYYTLFNFGPLICNRWYVNSPGVATIRVVELIRK